MENARNAKTALIVAIALVVVVAAAFLGYNLLAGQAGQASAPAQTATTSQQVQASQESAAAQSDYPLLADYDSTVFTEQGEALTLTEIADGKVFVMNFWATWCPYCIQEMDDYQAIYEDYRDRVSFAFIDATDGTRETVEMAATWLATNGHGTLPAFYDTQLDAAKDYGTTSLPTTVIVDANGQIVSYSVGRIDPARLRSVLDGMLAG